MGQVGRLTRLPDWEARLNALIESRRHAPFQWGLHDCCLFAADAVCAMTTVDVAAAYRGTYHSGAEAVRILHRARGVRMLVTTQLGQPIDPRIAGRGDVVVALGHESQEALGICLGSVYVLPGLRHLLFRSMDEARAAWAVE